jgi:hypothetical protein
MRRLAQVHPDIMFRLSGRRRATLRKRVEHRVHSKEPVRALQLYECFIAYGVYRPYAVELFGPTVTKVSQAVVEHEHLVVEHPDRKSKHRVGFTQMIHEAHGDTGPASGRPKPGGFFHVTYEDIKKCLVIMKAWEKKEGKHEAFVGSLTEYFPLHYTPNRERLTKLWGNYNMLLRFKTLGRTPEYMTRLAYNDPANVEVDQVAWLWQPIGEIRDYFGDGVALYFAFLGEYTKSLVFPAAFGFMVFMSQFVSGEGIDGNPLTIPFTAYMTLWLILFQCRWTRRENELKFLWGSEGFEADEKPRAQFVGQFVINLETKKEDYIVRQDGYLCSCRGQCNGFRVPNARRIKFAISALVQLLCMLVTTCCILYSKALVLYDLDEPDGAFELYGRGKWYYIGAFVALLVIIVLDQVYLLIADALTAWENHRTVTDQNDSIIIKNLLFQFVNNYFCLFCTAYIYPFIQGWMREQLSVPPGAFCYTLTACQGGSAAGEEVDWEEQSRTALATMQFELVVIFSGKILAKRLAEMYLPKLDNVVRKWMLQTGVRRRERKLDKKRHKVERQLHSDVRSHESIVLAEGLRVTAEVEGMPLAEQEAWLARREVSAVLIQTWFRGESARRRARRHAAHQAECGDGYTDEHGGKIIRLDEYERLHHGADTTRSAHRLAELQVITGVEHDVENERLLMPFDTTFDVFSELVAQVIPHHKTFSTTIQPPYSSTKG